MKLVRDNIPKLFNLKNIHIANREEYTIELIKKLQEEVDEFKESKKVEELADIIEVIHAISENYNVSVKDLEKIRKEKAKKRGKFKKGIILEDENNSI